MAFCRKCGIEIEDSAKFCPACGEPTHDDPFETAKNTAESKFNELNDTEDCTDKYEKSDIEDNKIISLFAYAGILILVPVIGAKGSPFAQFHIAQGINLIIAEVIIAAAIGVLSAIFSFSASLGAIISIISGVTELAILALIIIGVINCLNGRAKELPVIGKWKIIK